MRVLQLRGELDLAAEAVDVETRAELGRQHLDDDLAAERRLLGDEHAAHPPAAELALEAVGAAERRLQPGQQVGHGGPMEGGSRSTIRPGVGPSQSPVGTEYGPGTGGAPTRSDGRRVDAPASPQVLP